jgi:hypothetical protein
MDKPRHPLVIRPWKIKQSQKTRVNPPPIADRARLSPVRRSTAEDQIAQFFPFSPCFLCSMERPAALCHAASRWDIALNKLPKVVVWLQVAWDRL